MNAPLSDSLLAKAPTTAPEPLELPLDPKLLTRVLTGIRADSQSEAEIYLRDSVVPHGGE